MKKTRITLVILSSFSTLLAAQEASSGSEEALLQQQLDNLRQQLIQQNQQLHRLQNRLSASQPQSTAQDMAGRVSGERRTPAPSRSTEDLLIEQHNVFDRKFSLDFGLSYAYYDRKQLLLKGLVVYDAIFLGKIDTDRIRSHQWTADLTGRYTINDRWQAELRVPYVYRYMDYTVTDDGASQNDKPVKIFDSLSDGSIGDISAAVYYRVLTETNSRPDLVWNFRVTAPTGRDPFGIPNTPNDNTNLDVPTELATGTGLWGLSTGFSAVKTVDPAILFASVDYTHYLKDSFDDISVAAGNQPGEVQLGDSFGYGLGMAFALSERLSLSLNFNQSFNREAKQAFEGESLSEVQGSSGNSATMGMGVTWAIDDRLSMVVNWAAGLTQDAPDYVVGVRFPYRF
ncbi:transporter [Oceanisphaera pacifica]|uniref:Transporter n=1 Tax=Oceanisphaera pacifica TaxID=2818389 RepID=A0ABS3NF67_9GAMM|nr:transporter [Oceanisphaera pacifica]MBO1519218.1 transporter [Oceanisphaera pacifica]